MKPNNKSITLSVKPVPPNELEKTQAGIFGLCIIIFLGFTTYWLVTHHSLFIEKLGITKFDTLSSVSGTGKIVRIEGIATGEPPLKSSRGEQLAFQKLRISGRISNNDVRRWPILFDGCAPEYLRINTDKGSVYIVSSDLVEFEQQRVDSTRADIAVTMLNEFDKYVGATGHLRCGGVWTIKNGAHVSAIGEIIQDKLQNRYFLKPSSFWHAPLLGGLLWLNADDGIRTM